MLTQLLGKVKGLVVSGGGAAEGGAEAEGEGAPHPVRSLSHDGAAVSSVRRAKIERLLSARACDVSALRDASWAGLPEELRPEAWRVLLGYAPPSEERRAPALQRKRREYADWLPRLLAADGDRSEEEEATYRQISVDVPRTAAGAPFVAHPRLQQSLLRCLYVWAMRHPASGYVQGINDLATPFLAVFLEEKLRENAAAGSPAAAAAVEKGRRAFFFGRANDSEGCADGGGSSAGGGAQGEQEGQSAAGGREGESDIAAAVSSLPEALLLAAEADVYWCLCEMLDRIHDHYTFAQPGIQVKCDSLTNLIERLDPAVARNLEEQGVQVLQFAFRWFNCLLVREVPFACTPRLWDVYLSEGDDFPDFLIYVAASLLLTYRGQVASMEFQDLVMFLQALPTSDWGTADLDLVLSRAFMWRAKARLPKKGE